jgi:hypothetical protein
MLLVEQAYGTWRKEEGMAEQQPKKVGIYERAVARASGSTATVLGIIVLVLVLIILVVIFL